MEKRLAKVRRQRLAKLKELQQLGINPYPSRCHRRQSIAKARKMMGKPVWVAGRIMAIRGHGKIQFFDLLDFSGKIQLVFRADLLPKAIFRQLSLLDRGDFLEAKGEIFRTKAGEISVLVKKFNLLAKSIRPLPIKWFGLKNIETRYRRRFLDLLMNPEVRQVFVMRSRILKLLRLYLERHGFLEVETPILQPMYGGAAATPFTTHHRALASDFYLRISDELYLKRLLVGGFEKVYEVSRDFRNEGIDRFHNPEFTQIEFYWAYADYRQLMKFSEQLFGWLLRQLGHYPFLEYRGQRFNFRPPWPRLDFATELKKALGFDVFQFSRLEDLRQQLKRHHIKLERDDLVSKGQIYDRLYKKYLRPKIKGPAFLLNYPTAMIALAKRQETAPEKIASFQLILAGTELIKAYNELNDPLDQRQRWQAEEQLAQRGAKETERLDENYLEALEYGMPPTAGWGLGVDRLVMFLTNQANIKDVILFPTLRPR